MQLAHSFSAIKLYENCPKRYYHQRVTKEVQDTGGEASKYGERIHEFLEQRLVNNTPLPVEAEKYEVICKTVENMARGGELHAERQLTLTENLTPTSWFAGDAWLRSILDVLILKGDTAVVVDWKTGKRRPDFTQLEMFALQVWKHFPEVVTIKTSFVWLKDMAMDSEEFSREQSDEMWSNLLSRINRIYQSAEHENWPAKPSGLCRFCPAKDMCDYAQI
jgi:CRISPR/Cas system-associated exonuclease Cas4 (RecB family)